MSFIALGADLCNSLSSRVMWDPHYTEKETGNGFREVEGPVQGDSVRT